MGGLRKLRRRGGGRVNWQFCWLPHVQPGPHARTGSDGVTFGAYPIDTRASRREGRPLNRLRRRHDPSNFSILLNLQHIPEVAMSDSTVDWFVAADSKGGDGSRGNPFHDPWLALRSAGAGDTIHIAVGTYFGRYDRSSWIVDVPNLTIRGGYRRDFSNRSPWQTPSVLAAYHDYETTRSNFLMGGEGDHSGLTLDGIFFDSAGRNDYNDKPVQGISRIPPMEGAMASFNSKGVTIKNCVFANGATGGVELAGDGSRFENNLVINIVGLAMLNLRKASGEQLITVTHNTFCFTHDTAGPPLGKGADNAIGVRVNCPAAIQSNIFMSCGNAAIAYFIDANRISMDGNLFYVTPHAILAMRAGSSRTDLLEKNIEELEDTGLKSVSGNSVGNPGMSGLRPEWLDAYSRHLLANYATPPREAISEIRKAAGLPEVTPTDLQKPENKGDFAPKLSSQDVLALSFSANQGFHAVELPAQIPSPTPAPTPAYKPIEWNVIDNPVPSFANERVELRAGIGSEENTTLVTDATPATHLGIRVYRPLTDEGSIVVLAKRFTLTQVQFQEAIKSNNGREVETSYFLRGVYRTNIVPHMRQKVTLVVESIVRAPLLSQAPAPRPQGRDWFVRAGSSGGDGSRAKPFRDPFQALEKAEGGDAIHVAGGDYVGKLRSGQWRIVIRNLTLLGGYDAQFNERDPWKNPTRFALDAEEKAKGTRQGKILASDENSEGLVLDGFIFDGSTYNSYGPTGSLLLSGSPTDTMVSLMGVRSSITVRNCLFVNSSADAVSISCPFGVFENNVVLNANSVGLKIDASGPGPWVIRNNTFLFACDPTSRAGTGQSAPSGSLLLLKGRAETVVESNIFAFADNYGVRNNVPQQSVSYNNNIFAANLYNHLTDAQYLWADSSNWERRVVMDSGFASIKGNRLELPKLPVDSGFADKALPRLFALPSRISADEWRTFASQIGSSAVPAVPSDAPASPAPAASPQAAVDTAKTARMSLSDIIAGLGVKTTPPKAESPAAKGATNPIYCPVYDWKKALDLTQEMSLGGIGAHKQTLSVSFSVMQPRAEIQYTPVTPQEIGGDLAVLDNKHVEVELTDARDVGRNPSLFPPGLTEADYQAYHVSAVGQTGHYRIALLVRRDTAVSKVLYKTAPTDRLRIRGTARVLYAGALAIIAENAEVAERTI